MSAIKALWREYQRKAGHDDDAARFLVVTRGDYDLPAGLREALNNAHEELGINEPDDHAAECLVSIDWCQLIPPARTANDADGQLARRIYRVTLRPDASGWDDVGRDTLEDARPDGLPARGDGLVYAFADALSALPRGDHSTPGIDHTLKLHDPQRLAHYIDLHREIAAIEMASRECLSVIFLQAYPDDAHTFLGHTDVTTPKDDKPEPKDLAERHENELFHILFKDYPRLNDPAEVKVLGLVRSIREADSFDALRHFLGAFPIGSDDDGGFIAALKSLMDPIERIRNPVAHNRAIPKRAWESYENAREKIWELIAEFWARHPRYIAQEYQIRFERITDRSPPGSHCPGGELLESTFIPWSYDSDGCATYVFPYEPYCNEAGQEVGRLISLGIEVKDAVAEVCIVSETGHPAQIKTVEFRGPFHFDGTEVALPYISGELCVPFDFSGARALVIDLKA